MTHIDAKCFGDMLLESARHETCSSRPNHDHWKTKRFPQWSYWLVLFWGLFEPENLTMFVGTWTLHPKVLRVGISFIQICLVQTNVRCELKVGTPKFSDQSILFFLPVCLFLCLFLCPFICLSICLSAYLPIYLSIYLSIHQSI